jgi:hypothetical protein
MEERGQNLSQKNEVHYRRNQNNLLLDRESKQRLSQL